MRRRRCPRWRDEFWLSYNIAKEMVVCLLLLLLYFYTSKACMFCCLKLG